MRIGVLAYHTACNFGANLQVISTVGYLKNHGHEPYVLNYEPRDLIDYYKNNTSFEVFEAYKKFRTDVMPLTEYCNDVEELALIIDKYNLDGIIIGSDAVAQHHTLLERITFPSRHLISIHHVSSDRLFPNPFWGTFRDFLKKKIPMAILSASSQDSVYKLYSPSLKKAMYNRLKEFVYVSARDEWTQNLYNYVSKGRLNVKITPDPVFSFNQNSFDLIPSKEYILKKYNLPDKYFLLSFKNDTTVSRDWSKEFELVAEKYGIACVALPFPQGMLFSNSLRYQIPSPLLPLDWYALIKYSDGYVGHNMHPIVVSLHNSVPFFCFDSYGVSKYRGLYINDRTSKIYDILNRANLLANRVTCLKYNFRAPLPIVVINRLLDFDKRKCQIFANNYLEHYNITMSQILKKLEE